VIRVRGVPVTDDDAREIARLLRGDLAGIGVAVRIDRALATDGGLIPTNRDEARAVLAALDVIGYESERLLELRASLVAMADS
jgi:hypothetical protein